MVPNLLARRLDGASVLQLFTPDCSAKDAAHYVRREPKSFHRPEGAITYAGTEARPSTCYTYPKCVKPSATVWSSRHLCESVGISIFHLWGARISGTDHRDPLQAHAHKQRSLRNRARRNRVLEVSQGPWGSSQGSDWNTLSDLDDQENDNEHGKGDRQWSPKRASLEIYSWVKVTETRQSCYEVRIMRHSKLCVCVCVGTKAIRFTLHRLMKKQTDNKKLLRTGSGSKTGSEKKVVSGGEVKLTAGNIKHSKCQTSEGPAPFMRRRRYFGKTMSHLSRSYHLNTRANNSVMSNRWRSLAAIATGNRNEFRGGNGDCFRKVKWRGKRDKINEDATFPLYYYEQGSFSSFVNNSYERHVSFQVSAVNPS